MENERRAIAILEALSLASPNDTTTSEMLAGSYSNLGGAYTELGSRSSASTAAQAQSWRTARSSYARALEIWIDVQRHATGDTSGIKAAIDRTTGQVAGCDAALSKLRAK